jgi:hypothetical protein
MGRRVIIQKSKALYPTQLLPEKREGSGAGSIPLANGSGSGSRRPNNMQILRIRIPKHCVPLFNNDIYPGLFHLSFSMNEGKELAG